MIRPPAVKQFRQTSIELYSALRIWPRHMAICRITLLVGPMFYDFSQKLVSPY